MNKLTQEQYDKLRASVEDYFPKDVQCTCDTCGARLNCFGAADPYNTDGDCLMEK